LRKAALPKNDPPKGGVDTLFGDGSVKFVESTIDGMVTSEEGRPKDQRGNAEKRQIGKGQEPETGNRHRPLKGSEIRVSSCLLRRRCPPRTRSVPVEAKSIFRLDVIRLPLLGYKPPEQVTHVRPEIEMWAEIIGTGSVDADREHEILATWKAWNWV
jgi:hypothetical protein